MNALQTVLTEATCGAACWYAKEDVCRCSCGGKNHGVLLDPDNPSPERIVKIDGTRYRLEAAGSYSLIHNLAAKALRQLGWRRIDSKTTYTDGTPYHYEHHDNDKGAAIRVKTASTKQREWPEVQLAGVPKNFTAYILWVAVDVPDPVWCDASANCERCIDKMFTLWQQAGPAKLYWEF